MRKIFTIICSILIFSCAAKAQYANIPDVNFRNYLKNLYPTCFNSTGQMDTTCNAIVNGSSLVIENYTAGIKNLDGLRYFKNILTLTIYDHISSALNNIDTIPELPLLLKYFECWGSKIRTLPILPSGFETLIWNSASNLSHLPAFPNSLKRLELKYCLALNSIPPISNTGLVYFDCQYNTGSGISPLTSLPNFPNSLKYLNCTGHQNLNSLPPLASTQLDTLIFSSCAISGLPALPQSLKFLQCSFNPLSQFPPLPSSLLHLECFAIGNFQDTSIHIIMPNPLPPNLIFLDCGGNHLSSLPLLPNSLITLIAYTNVLTGLPPLPNALQEINIDNNITLHSISTFPASLLIIRCAGDSLSTLPELPPFLEQLYCNNNNLTALPPLPNSVQTLSCHSNYLSSLPDLPAALKRLFCFENNIYCLPKLPSAPDVLELQIDSKIMCLPNYRNHIITGIWGPSNGIPYTGQYPLCNPTNNSNNCQSFPIMQGIIYYDNNSNGIRDVNEPVKVNGEVLLSNGSFGFTNNSGFYEIGADSIGTYNLSIAPPRYYNPQPNLYSYHFNNYDTLVIKNFALQPNTTVEELSIKIIPINRAARPGFSFPYMISYENTGTTILPPNIIFDYDETRLSYNTSSIAGVIDNSSTLSINAGSLAPGQSGSFIGYFNLKPSAAIGDSLRSTAMMSAGTYETTDYNAVAIRGSFDPNDKQATPQLSPTQVANGKYIDYTIRFQNTGNDTAFNIVISDTLSNMLQANTLEMIASSHSCKATVKNGIVFFEFLNILLPDKNIDEPKSHGFVSFSIKPKTTVAANTTINNKAAIYFDYNSPIITNTANTLIKNFTIVPLHLVSFTAIPQFNNTTALSWITSNEINTKNFVIEQSNDAYHFTTVATVLANGRSTNNYNSTVNDLNNNLVYYRLKIVDMDGSFSYSPVITIDRRKNTTGFNVLSIPVKDAIIINTNDQQLNGTSCNIINMQGAVVKQFLLQQGSQSIDVKSLPAGIYYLKTNNGSSRILIQ